MLGGVGAALRAFEANHSVNSYRDRFAHPVPRLRESMWLAECGITAAIDEYKFTWGKTTDGLDIRKPLGEKNPKWLLDDYVKFIRFAQNGRVQLQDHGA